MFEISSETKDLQFAMGMKMTLKNFNSAFLTACFSHLQLAFERLSVIRFSTLTLTFSSVLSTFFRFTKMFISRSAFDLVFRVVVSKILRKRPRVKIMNLFENVMHDLSIS